MEWCTPVKTNECPLQNSAWNTILFFWKGSFSGRKWLLVSRSDIGYLFPGNPKWHLYFTPGCPPWSVNFRLGNIPFSAYFQGANELALSLKEWWKGESWHDRFSGSFGNGGAVDGSEIRLTTWDVQNLVKNGINYQPQLVQDSFHQQGHWCLSWGFRQFKIQNLWLEDMEISNNLTPWSFWS